MDPVSNVDRLVMVLRQRLLERSRQGAAKPGAKPHLLGGRPTPLDRVQALAAVNGVDDRQLGRALIQGILAEQFGEGLVNEAKFQQVVDRVTETINADAQTAQLMARAVEELRAAAA